MELEDLLEKYKMVKYRIREEGMDYTFRQYSSFEDIEDPEFHKLRKYYIQHANLMEFYIDKQINRLEEVIESFSDGENG